MVFIDEKNAENLHEMIWSYAEKKKEVINVSVRMSQSIEVLKGKEIRERPTITLVEVEEMNMPIKEVTENML